MHKRNSHENYSDARNASIEAITFVHVYNSVTKGCRQN